MSHPPSSHRPAVFITGGAAGIGRATAELFARRGWTVGIYDIDGSAAQAVAQSLPTHDSTSGQEMLKGKAAPAGRHASGTLDVTDAEQWRLRLRDFAQHTGGRLDLLLNNAGIAVTDPYESTQLSRLHRMVDVNLKGVMNGCHTALPHLRATPHSRVINLCSASALYGQPMLAVYSATKAAVRSLTEALDIEWSRYGIRVVDVLPLFVNTAMVADEVRKMPTVARLGVRLSPQDVAQAIWKLTEGRPAALPVHTMVGWQTTLFALAGKLSPVWMNKWVTAKLAGY